jgi:hypothetical protein
MSRGFIFVFLALYLDFAMFFSIFAEKFGAMAARLPRIRGVE